MTWQRAVGRLVETLARWLAFLGGLVLVGVALMVVASIIGRALDSIGLGQIRGDYELVQLGTGFAVFCFLPWCQLRRGHVSVDLLVRRFGKRVEALFGFLGDTLITLAAFVIAWRLWPAFGEKFPYGPDALREALSMGYRPFYPETTYELQIPVWIPYAAAFIGASVFFLTALYTVWRSLNWLIEGREQPA